MGKEIYTKLEKISSMLPPSFIYETRTELGALILKRNPNAQWNNEPLDPKKYYKVKVGVAVNHYKTLKKLMTTKGMPAVKKYTDSFIQG